MFGRISAQEEVETISLRNEDATVPSKWSTEQEDAPPYGDEMETRETSFISPDLADVVGASHKETRNLQKDASLKITKPNGQKAPVSPQPVSTHRGEMYLFHKPSRAYT